MIGYSKSSAYRVIFSLNAFMKKEDLKSIIYAFNLGKEKSKAR